MDHPLSGRSETTPVAVASGGFDIDIVTGKPIYPLTDHTISTASTNAKVIKASKGVMIGFIASNAANSARYIKIYDKATAPNVGVDVPKLTIGIPSVWSREYSGPPIAFQDGIAIAITTGIADADATAATAGDVAFDFLYL